MPPGHKELLGTHNAGLLRYERKSVPGAERAPWNAQQWLVASREKKRPRGKNRSLERTTVACCVMREKVPPRQKELLGTHNGGLLRHERKSVPGAERAPWNAQRWLVAS